MGMEIALLIAIAIATFSTGLSVYLWLERRELRSKLASKSKDEPTYDCRELLHDLTEGTALVRITRISPMDVFIRRS